MIKMLENRYEIMALVEARMCNPNGDPDLGNAPRMDFVTNQGIITDVAFKSRMRNYVNHAYADKDGYSILMRNGNSINRDIAEANISVNGGKPDKGKNTKEAAAFMCEKYWDVRTFGAVLSTGLNAGQVRGATQVGMSLSVDPIEAITSTITRCCYTADVPGTPTLEKYDKKDAEMSDDAKRTMGTKSYTPYGLYVMKMTVSANLADKVGFDEEDLRILLESVVQMYNDDASSSKMGMSVLTPVMVFKHVGTNAGNAEQLRRECKLGCASAYKLFELLEIQKKEDVIAPRKYQDYDIVLHLENLPNGVVCGLKKSAYADIDWMNVKEPLNLSKLL